MVDSVKQINSDDGLACAVPGTDLCAPAAGSCAGGHPATVPEEILVLLLALGERLRQQVTAIASSFDLTPQQVMLMDHLATPQTMGQLADTLRCDPSNVTGLIKRLEQRGLVARTPDDNDRRTKWLALTAAGSRTREEFRLGIFQEAAGISGLTTTEQAQLVELLRTVGASVGLATAPESTCINEPQAR